MFCTEEKDADYWSTPLGLHMHRRGKIICGSSVKCYVLLFVLIIREASTPKRHATRSNTYTFSRSMLT